MECYNPSLRLDINSLYNYKFIKDFHPIDIQKCENKFNNKIIFNTKDKQNIWFLFQIRRWRK